MFPPPWISIFLEDGRSFALADFDHDGRQEVFLKNRSGPQLRLLKNVVDELPPSISLPAPWRKEQSRRDRRCRYDRNPNQDPASWVGIPFTAQ